MLTTTRDVMAPPMVSASVPMVGYTGLQPYPMPVQSPGARYELVQPYNIPPQKPEEPEQRCGGLLVPLGALVLVAAAGAMLLGTKYGMVAHLREYIPRGSQAAPDVPTAAPSGQSVPDPNFMKFDCEAGFSHWQEQWSPYKQQWCCTNFNRGCIKSSTVDCKTGYDLLTDFSEEWDESRIQHCCKKFNRMCPRPRPMTFFMYRAQSDANYPMENVNMADLPGVMWYLHNEVVVSTPRKYDVTRILRFRVTVRNTPELYADTHRQFGPYVAFDSARCTVPNCSQIWQDYGYVVGCQPLNISMQNYVTFSSAGCLEPSCKSGSWYSLPGLCPSKSFESKNLACAAQWPGGACKGGIWGRDCTYTMQFSGQVRLDDLVGIANYTEFRSSGSFEYNATADRGHNFSWWDGRHDQANCTRRMSQVRDLFESLYPDTDPALQASEPPPCWAA